LGGPSDKHPYGELKMPDFHAHQLKQGINDNRRCQASPTYYFLAYETEIKRISGSVAYLAGNKFGASLPDEQVTIDELSDVRNYLNEPSRVAPLGMAQAELDATNSNIEKDKLIKKMLRKMMPYSRPLDGTAPMLAQERRKLLCLLSAPALVNEGQWNWFITFAMPDLFDPKLFDILDGKTGNAQSDVAWTYEKRLKAVRRSPALIARIFSLKQFCIFEYIIKGSNKPFGEVVADWLRNEFQERGTVHLHGMVRKIILKNEIGFFFKVFTFKFSFVQKQIISPRI